MVSVRRVAPILLLLAAIPALAQKTSTNPPRDLHLVGNHYTPYFPPDPATYPANAKTHEVVAGDTLWALAQKYYGNAYLWPQLWESNTWITDAHWIYPGDVLLVEGEAQAPAAEVAEGPVLSGGDVQQPVTEVEQAPESTLARPIPLATENDVYCYGYIGEPNESLPNYFSSIEDTEVMYLQRADVEAAAMVATGDLIYITGGSSTGLVAGDTYMAVEPGPMVYHPKTKAPLGQHYAYVGQIRILCTEPNRSRAIVTQACREIKVGTRLKPMPQLPIPIVRVPEMAQWCDPESGRVTGTIVASRDWDLGLVEGNLVQLDIGSDSQIQPGDFLTVFRQSPRPDQPRMVLGQIGVLTTQAKTATGIIVGTRREIQVGDNVELR